VRVVVELGINKVRETARPAVDLDQVRSLNFAQIGPTAAFVNSQERFESVQGPAVDEEVVGRCSALCSSVRYEQCV
jgi:hypothetical protein